MIEFNDLAADDRVIWYRRTLISLTYLTSKLQEVSKLIAVDGVVDKALSKRLAGEIMNIHQATIARWVKDEFHNEFHPLLLDKPEDEQAADLEDLRTKIVKTMIDETID